jgi:hypothetical protein
MNQVDIIPAIQKLQQQVAALESGKTLVTSHQPIPAKPAKGAQTVQIPNPPRK